jgi:hypothetical protein
MWVHFPPGFRIALEGESFWKFEVLLILLRQFRRKPAPHTHMISEPENFIWLEQVTRFAVFLHLNC